MVIYWQALPKTCPLQVLFQTKALYFTINLRAFVVVLKFELSFLTYVIILFLNPYAFNKSIKFMPLPIMWSQ